MLWTWTYFPFALSFFSCSVLQQSHDLGSETINNQFHDGSASKTHEIQIIEQDSDVYLQIKLAFLIRFLYFCPSSVGNVSNVQNHNGKKLHKVSNEEELWPNSGNPWSLVSSTPCPCCLSWTGRGTAQCHGTATALHEVMSRGFELSWYLLFPTSGCITKWCFCISSP